MSGLAASLLQWVRDAVDPAAPVHEVTALRDGGAPWVIRLGEWRVVLRVGTEWSDVHTEAEAMRAVRHVVPVPPVLAVDPSHDPPLLLIGHVGGASTIPADQPTDRLRTLGATAARLHRSPVVAHLPRRTRPIGGTDFGAMRAAQAAQELLVRAERAVVAYEPRSDDGVVHGDLWQGNALWQGDELAALIDWDCAGTGAAGVDLGSLRCDAALCFGVDAADVVMAGWTAEAGVGPHDADYWDVVAALSTPPDLGWFVSAIAGQGREDLDRATLLHRRDEFLTAALDRLC